MLSRCNCGDTPALEDKGEDEYYRFRLICPVCGTKTDFYPTEGGANHHWNEFIATGREKPETVLSDVEYNARHYQDAIEMVERYCQEQGLDIHNASKVIDYVYLAEEYVKQAGNIRNFANRDIWTGVISEYLHDQEITFEPMDIKAKLGRQFQHFYDVSGKTCQKKTMSKLVDYYLKSQKWDGDTLLTGKTEFEMNGWLMEQIRKSKKKKGKN